MCHGVENAGLENTGLKSMESVTIFKSKSYGAEIKTVYGGMDTSTDGDDSADDTDASTKAVVAADDPASFLTFTLRCVL